MVWPHAEEAAVGKPRAKVRVAESVTELGEGGRVMGWEELRSRLLRCGLSDWVKGVEKCGEGGAGGRSGVGQDRSA